MSRHKEIGMLTWKGEALQGPKDVVLVLHPTDDPTRRLMFPLSPTNARKLERILVRSELVVK